MRRLIIGLVFVAPFFVIGATPSSAAGWYGYGYGYGGCYAPRAYGYSYYRPAYYSYYRPRFAYGSFYGPRVWGWRGWRRW